ncbi:MAG: Epimerase family protein [Pelotomaculum sp. PtaB.Bin104]|nr:MAG: Epimerase family protein [Pelotomaculum sp. PtaB.Bin104]
MKAGLTRSASLSDAGPVLYNLSAIVWLSVQIIRAETACYFIFAKTGTVPGAGESIGNRRWTRSVKEKILYSRVRTTQAIVNAIKQKRDIPKVLINASTDGRAARLLLHHD